jgi:hypothetical protein
MAKIIEGSYFNRGWVSASEGWGGGRGHPLPGPAGPRPRAARVLLPPRPVERLRPSRAEFRPNWSHIRRLYPGRCECSACHPSGGPAGARPPGRKERVLTRP